MYVIFIEFNIYFWKVKHEQADKTKSYTEKCSEQQVKGNKIGIYI